MWYEDVMMDQPDDRIFSRKVLFTELKRTNQELNYNTFKWLMPELLSKGLIFRVGYDTYTRSMPSGKLWYTPDYSKYAQTLLNTIESEYPLAEFYVFESILLNEFLNHQIAQNTIVIPVEKEVGSFVFDFLDEKLGGRILYKPDEREYQRYWRENCVIIVDRVSESPRDRQNPHHMILEKLLVDLFAETAIKRLFSPGEYPLIMEIATGRYFIDEKKMLRYARRRNAAEKMIVYMETFRDDCKGKL